MLSPGIALIRVQYFGSLTLQGSILADQPTAGLPQIGTHSAMGTFVAFLTGETFPWFTDSLSAASLCLVVSFDPPRPLPTPNPFELTPLKTTPDGDEGRNFGLSQFQFHSDWLRIIITGGITPHCFSILGLAITVCVNWSWDKPTPKQIKLIVCFTSKKRE